MATVPAALNNSILLPQEKYFAVHTLCYPAIMDIKFRREDDKGGNAG
jgi:hypothetical protein